MLSNKRVHQNVPNSKKAITTAYFPYVEGLMMRKTVRYQINACVRTCRIQRSNPDGVFLIRRGIDDAEDGALSRTYKK